MERALSILMLGSALTLTVAAVAHGTPPPVHREAIDWVRIRGSAYALAVMVGESMLNSEETCGPTLECNSFALPEWGDSLTFADSTTARGTAPQ